MAKGYDFEQEVDNYLSTGFSTQRNYQALSEMQGKRREIDIIATLDIPPFGDVHFLVECKAIKVGVNHVKEFKDKLDDIKRGGDPYSSGTPYIVTSEAWSAPAGDEAKKCGIKMFTFEQLQSANIPIPRNIDLHIFLVHNGNVGIMAREETITIPEWGNVSIVKSNIDHTIKGLGTFDIYMELKKGVVSKELIMAFGKYIGKASEDIMRVWIQKIDGYVEALRNKGNKVSAVIGFYTRSVSDDDKKMITKIKNSTKSSVAVIDEDLKIYGNQDAKRIFTP
jgi:hypothetical protein